MSALASFLLARFDEDETIARGCTEGPWEYREGTEIVRAVPSNGKVCGEVYGWSGTDPDHIARHDPIRVLADIEAKRQLMAWDGAAHDAGSIWECVTCGSGSFDRPCMLALLALPYAAHPDYLEEWRP